jgi:hypothetical protein
MTQFGRALAELNIEMICANSSQAKGRVERANRTLQDRLVKELRLDNLCDLEAGNAFLPRSSIASTGTSRVLPHHLPIWRIRAQGRPPELPEIRQPPLRSAP